MTQQQQEVTRVTDVAAARALRQDNDFLSLFTAPRSPSEVAPGLGMAANLAHHHARKLADLGLLFEARRESGKVFYQLAAREFRVPWEVLPPVDEAGGEELEVRRLTMGFWQAYERSYRQTGQNEEAVFGFGDSTQPTSLPPAPTSPPAEPYPTHLDSLTLQLTPERFRRLARAMSALLAEAQAEGAAVQGRSCTVAVLAFQDVQQERLGQQVSRRTSSFLGSDIP